MMETSWGPLRNDSGASGESGYDSPDLLLLGTDPPLCSLSLVLEALIVLVGKPNLEEPVQLELAELLTQNPEMFKRNAEEFTLRFGEDRPS